MERLIILTYDFRPNDGGISRTCAGLADYCRSIGRPYLVVTTVPGEEEENVVRITGKRLKVDFEVYRYLRRNLRKGDSILTFTYHPDGLIGWLTGYPTYFMAHGAEFLPGKTFFRKHIWKYYMRYILRKPKKIIANSNYTMNLVKSMGTPVDVVAVLPPVNHLRFAPSKPKYNDGLLHLFSVCRLLKYKAQDFVINTIAGLPDFYKNKIRYSIAGKGPYKDNLEAQVKELNLQNIVDFLGFVSDEDLCDLYSQHDILILTTRLDPDNVEGFGLVFTEAQACGTPCIGTRSGGIPDAVGENEGGWLINEDCEQELADLLKKLIDNPTLVTDASRRARNRIEEGFTMEKFYNKLMAEMD